MRPTSVPRKKQIAELLEYETASKRLQSDLPRSAGDKRDALPGVWINRDPRTT
jgi:hypothetical protein